MTQRDKMRELYRQFAGDKDLVVKAYSEAELAGEVNRLRNSSGYGTLQYAFALWSDGEKKGWLTQSGIEPSSSSNGPVGSSSLGSVQPSPKKSASNVSTLIRAVCNNDAAAVRTLLDSGANPNGLDEDADTPLTEAVWRGNQDIVKLLLSVGADHDAKNSAGESAMEIAVSKGNVEMVRLLQNVAKERILKPKRSVELDNNPQLETLMRELKGMVGLNLVKAHIESQRHRLRLQKLKEKEGLPTTPQILHLVFTGNPGTGKTTVARLLAKIYQAMGVLSKGQLIEVTDKDLIGTHVGDTQEKTTKIIESALGGVLFLDEAYNGPKNLDNEMV